MKLTWLQIKHFLMTGGRWLFGLIGIILLYIIAGRSTRLQRKADRAADKYWDSSATIIQTDWRDAEKHRRRHENAQNKAKKAKQTARKVRDAVANNNSDIDDLFDEYNSRRLSGSKNSA